MIREENILGPHPFLNEKMNHNEKKNAIIIPSKGANRMNDAVLITGAELTALKLPACAMAAPANPPIRVCDEDDGIPDHQVSRFQIIAAIKPANTTSNVIQSGFTVLAIVLATP